MNQESNSTASRILKYEGGDIFWGSGTVGNLQSRAEAAGIPADEIAALSNDAVSEFNHLLAAQRGIDLNKLSKDSVDYRKGRELRGN